GGYVSVDCGGWDGGNGGGGRFAVLWRQPVIAVNANARHVNRHARPRRHPRKRPLKIGDPLFLGLGPERTSLPCDPPGSPGFPPFCASRQSIPCARVELPGRSCTGPYSEV